MDGVHVLGWFAVNENDFSDHGIVACTGRATSRLSTFSHEVEHNTQANAREISSFYFELWCLLPVSQMVVDVTQWATNTS